MTEAGPLAGKRVVVTRSNEQAGGLAAELERYGAEVLYLPLVRYEPVENNRPLDDALRNLSKFGWLVFTSQNVVRFITARLETLHGRSTAFTKVAAVGAATADTARAAGWEVDFISNRATGAALARELGERVRGERVLLPRSDRARPDLPEALRRAGAEVTEVVAYRTVREDVEQSDVVAVIRAGRVDVVTFASPSAFDSFLHAAGIVAGQGAVGELTIAVIGPVTAEAVRAAGWPVHVEAEESSAEGLARAIAGYYEGQRATSGAKRR